ncbi:MAG: hypothetical protein ACHQK8_02965 [Bacteroidia bacterium]
MENIHSPFRNPNPKPNVMYNILDRVQPDLDKINSYFGKREYQKVIEVYENLTRQYNFFETDLSKIAFCYYRLGKYQEAEEFILKLNSSGNVKLDDLLILAEIKSGQGRHSDVIAVCDETIQKFQSPEASLLKASIFKAQEDDMQEMHAYFETIRLLDTELNSTIRFKVYSELARIASKYDMDEAGHYLFMCFSFIQQKEDLDTLEFFNALNMLNNELKFLVNDNIRSLIRKHNVEFNGEIERLYFYEYEKVCRPDAYQVELGEYSKDLIESGTELLDKVKQRVFEKGDVVLRSISEHLLREEPTFAYSYSE